MKLPMIIYPKGRRAEIKGRMEGMAKDEEDQRTGHWYPRAINMIDESSASTSVAREMFGDTKDFAAERANNLQLESSYGVFSMAPETQALRGIQLRSDMSVARRIHKLYVRKMSKSTHTPRARAPL
jgi:hypothetical protein